jgi:hypothetical protein
MIGISCQSMISQRGKSDGLKAFPKENWQYHPGVAVGIKKAVRRRPLSVLSGHFANQGGTAGVESFVLT